jgi:TP901 family phage tail tape measure protein
VGTVANLVVRVGANISDFEKQIGSLGKSFDRAGANLQSAGSKLTAGITLPLAGAAIASVKFASDFEKSTTKLVTLSGLSTKELKRMQQAVLAMSTDVGIGPRALSDALLVVTSTGFEGGKALELLKLSAMSTAVGMGETTDVARALTSAVSAYGEKNLTAAQAADILHATVVAGGAEATELAGELGRVVGIASQLGVSFTEVGAFIATYTRLGLSAAEATTGLSGALNTILSPSAEARKALAEIGLSADGLRKMVAEQGLGAALTTLLGKLHGNADAIGAVFGNVRALAGVMGTAGVQAAGYAKTLDQIKGSTGGLNRAFEETKKTFAFQWDQFKAQAERAAITLGTQLLPAMTRILQAAKPLGEMIVGMIGWFSQLPPWVQSTTLGFFALAAALGPVLYAFGTILKTGGAVLGVFKTMGATSMLASGNLVLMGGALAGIAVGLMKVYSAWQNAKAAFNVGGIKAVIGELGRNVNDDSKSFFRDWRVDQQPNRRRGGAASGGPLPVISPGALAGGAAAAAQRQALEDAMNGFGTAGSGYTPPSAPRPRLGPLAPVTTPNIFSGFNASQFGTAAALPQAASTWFYPGMMPAPAGMPATLPGTSADMSNINPLANVGFMAQAFGTGKQFGYQLGDSILSGIQGGWKGIVGSVGSMFGGNIGKKLGGMLSGKGGILGGLSSMLGPLGSMLGGLIGPLFSKISGGIAKLFGKGDDGDKQRDEFLKSMGGFDALAQTLHKDFGAEGDKMFAALQKGGNGAAVTAAADKIKDALEQHAAAIQAATEGLPSAVNARAANITSQSDANTVGAEAMGTFQFLVSQGQSAVQAFNAIAPAVTAMRDAMAANNFEVSAASQRLFELGSILTANKVQFDNIAASGSILSLQTQANIKDYDLFSAAASDVGANLQKIIDNGVPTAQALALAQPQLQALWEAQQKFGFETDAATQALIDQAVTQGIVGQNMKDVNQKILDVLVLIGDALGAKIPAALRGLPAVAGEAAAGMNAAFSGVRPPSFMSKEDAEAWLGNRPSQDVYAYQSAGGGGVTPMSSSTMEGGVSGGQGDVYLDGELVGRVLLPAMTAEAQRLGVS